MFHASDLYIRSWSEYSGFSNIKEKRKGNVLEVGSTEGEQSPGLAAQVTWSRENGRDVGDSVM